MRLLASGKCSGLPRAQNMRFFGTDPYIVKRTKRRLPAAHWRKLIKTILN